MGKKCKVCGIDCGCCASVWNHLSQHMREELLNNGYMKCEICGAIRDSSRSGGIMRHVKNAHKMDKYDYAKKFNVPGYWDVCKYCGREFKTNTTYRTKHNNDKLKPANCGSKECNNLVRKELYLLKTGYDNPRRNPEVVAKINRTCIEKYGGLSWLCDKEKREKYFEENMKKFGYKMPVDSEESLAKSRATFVKKYGVSHVGQVPEFQEKSIRAFREKYGVNCTFQIPEFLEKSRNTCMEKYGGAGCHDE